MFEFRSRALIAAALTALVAAGAATAPALADTGAPAAAGSFPLTFTNETDGKWKDSQIYVTLIGQTTPGQYAYLKTDGTLAPIDHKMADAPGHLTKDGRNYPNMSFTLAQASTVNIPPRIDGARTYISVGAPMYFGVAPDDTGYATPDLHNRADPNYGTVFDFYEFTYEYGERQFGGNTTQVDQFGLPLTARLQQSAIGFDRKTGITLSRAQVFARFEDKTSKPFHSLVTPERILAPRTSPAFSDTGAYAHYLDPAIDKAWSSWADGFSLTRLHQTFAGKTAGGKLTFKQDGDGPFSVAKPSSEDVFRCAGTLAPPNAPDPVGVMGAELCAAFNRGVSSDTTDWYKPSAYYDGRLDNEYSGFFHSISLGKRAYGFAYDDVNDQSTVTILPNDNPPSRVTLAVGW
jgi:hypothetical protein